MMMNTVRLFFSVGGDGTLLRAIHTYIDKLDEIQFVAIHTGNLGFLRTIHKMKWII